MKNLRRGKILGVLKEADRPLSVEELSEKTGIPVPRLRVDLFRLKGEGKIESREKGRELQWTIRVSKPAESRYEKLARKYTP